MILHNIEDIIGSFDYDIITWANIKFLIEKLNEARHELRKMTNNEEGAKWEMESHYHQLYCVTREKLESEKIRRVVLAMDSHFNNIKDSRYAAQLSVNKILEVLEMRCRYE